MSGCPPAPQFSLLIYEQSRNLTTNKHGRNKCEGPPLGYFASADQILASSEVADVLEEYTQLYEVTKRDFAFLRKDRAGLERVMKNGGGVLGSVHCEERDLDDLDFYEQNKKQTELVVTFELVPAGTTSKAKRVKTNTTNAKTASKFRVVYRFSPGDEDVENDSEEEVLGEFPTAAQAAQKVRADYIQRHRYGDDDEDVDEELGDELKAIETNGQGVVSIEHEYCADRGWCYGDCAGEMEWAVEAVRAMVVLRRCGNITKNCMISRS